MTQPNWIILKSQGCQQEKVKHVLFYPSETSDFRVPNFGKSVPQREVLCKDTSEVAKSQSVRWKETSPGILMDSHAAEAYEYLFTEKKGSQFPWGL